MKEILVTAYPKSGITWLIHLLSDLLQSPQQDQPLGDLKYWGPIHRRDYAIRKRHSTYNLPHYEFNIIPEYAIDNIIIFLQRDPRDVAVSQWHFRGRKQSFEDSTRVLWQSVPITYQEWVSSWDHCNTAIKVKYEDLQTHKATELIWLETEICGMRLNGHLDYYRNVYNRHTIDKMTKYLMRPDGPDRITRKGIVGDWRNHFTKEFAKEFNDNLGEFMLEQGYIDSPNWCQEL